MSFVINFLTIVGLLYAALGDQFFIENKKKVFPLKRSAAFVNYRTELGPFVDGRPCRPDALNNPLLTAKDRAKECGRR